MSDIGLCQWISVILYLDVSIAGFLLSIQARPQAELSAKIRWIIEDGRFEVRYCQVRIMHAHVGGSALNISFGIVLVGINGFGEDVHCQLVFSSRVVGCPNCEIGAGVIWFIDRIRLQYA